MWTIVLAKEANKLKPVVKKRKTQVRTIETKTKVLDAALLEFADKGFEGTSTRQIADRAGVRHTLLSYHFENKEGLWKIVIQNLNERFRMMFQSRMAATTNMDSHLKLRLIFEEFIRFSFNNPEFHWIMTHEASREGERMEWMLNEYVQPFFFATEELIREAQKSGHFVKGDPRHLLYLFIGAVSRVFMIRAEVENILDVPFNDPTFIKRHSDLCLVLFFRDPD
jgi:TetR/AcrR family transcriptional regulator